LTCHMGGGLAGPLFLARKPLPLWQPVNPKPAPNVIATRQVLRQVFRFERILHPLKPSGIVAVSPWITAWRNLPDGALTEPLISNQAWLSLGEQPEPGKSGFHLGRFVFCKKTWLTILRRRFFVPTVTSYFGDSGHRHQRPRLAGIVITWSYVEATAP